MKGARIKWYTHSKWCIRTYEFETPYQYLALRFVTILNNMGINLVDAETCPDHIGSSWIKFSCTKKDRLRAEYVYRRMCKLEIQHVDNNYSNQRSKYENDHYMIY